MECWPGLSPTGCETPLVFRGSREKHLKQGDPSRTQLRAGLNSCAGSSGIIPPRRAGWPWLCRSEGENKIVNVIDPELGM